MDVIKKYKVLDKVFDTKDEALKYEDSIRNNLNLRVRNIILYDYHVGESLEARELMKKFCKYRTFKFGKYKDCYISDVLFWDPRYIAWCLKNIPDFKLNKEEEAFYKADRSFTTGGWCWNLTTDEIENIPQDYPDFKLISYEKNVF